MTPIAGVVIPAHNEERGILRTLAALHDGLQPGDLEVVVVCNGCADRTAEVVRTAYPDIKVLEIPQPSKADAVAVGNAASSVFPRVHLDAGVRITGVGIMRLVAPLVAPDEDGVLATAPHRVLDTKASALLVRSYYDVWEQLPQVRDGLFGRGVCALSEAGQARVDALPRLMRDDLAVSEAFAPSERLVVRAAQVMVVPPRTVRDLVRRRVLAATGNAQASAAGARSDAAATSVRMLAKLSLSRPALAIRMPVFVGIALVAKSRSRKAVRGGAFHSWLRDKSSHA